MAPKRPKNVPPILGPPHQLAALGLGKMSLVHQEERLLPKMGKLLAKNAKMLAQVTREKMSLKKVLMCWMVVLVASKMLLLLLTYKFFSSTSLISLQVNNVAIMM